MAILEVSTEFHREKESVRERERKRERVREREKLIISGVNFLQ